MTTGGNDLISGHTPQPESSALKATTTPNRGSLPADGPGPGCDAVGESVVTSPEWHWIIRYDPCDGKPYHAAICYCSWSDDHDDDDEVWP